MAEGWAFDEAGLPTTDPDAALSLSPLGGYKGFGLGLMVEVLCSMLAGGPGGNELVAMYEDLSVRPSISHFFMALDLAPFVEPQIFRRRVTEMAEQVRSLPRIDDAEPIMVPGDPEKRARACRMGEGIPIDKAKLEEFLALDASFRQAVLT